MNSAAIRQTFIDFFKSKQHTFVPGSPVVPEHDPTLLFINAGMNQFKDVFLGEGKREYTRAVNSQICIRVSGKHNDLEDVGKDTTHQTSFEMLGNWSFGDYYKKEAIVWAWELLTVVFKIPKKLLYVTVFESDDEAEMLWKTHTDIHPDRIIKCDAKDNFWEMGDVGPCGPCSEIHADLWADQVPAGRVKKADADLAQADLGSDRFIELWNLVFIQFNRTPNGTLEELPAKHVDTGAGLERLAGFLQGSRSNYDTDLLRPIIDKIAAITGVAYPSNTEWVEESKIGKSEKSEALERSGTSEQSETLEKTYKAMVPGMPHRVIADHIRTLCFAIADNVRPSNDGRGYVLRRLLRRALRYAAKLDYHEPILVQLVDTVVEILGDHFTHLGAQKELIKTLIQAEEESFLQTLQSGIVRFNELESGLKKEGKHEISGEDAFKLYDTFGFPLDLTQVMAEEAGLTLDLDGFKMALEVQKSRSRASTKAKQQRRQEALSGAADSVDYSHLKTLPLFLSEYTDNIARGGEARIITDADEKMAMARHHTATHLLQAGLHAILGTHVNQAGSLVDTDRLRFDFTHFKAVTKEELDQIEVWINDQIAQSLPLSVAHMTLAQAKSAGAMALFGEKYNEDDVRVIKIGAVSTELCGGTHVQNTGQIEQVKIIAESAVAAGIRRIEALAGADVIRRYEAEQRAQLIEKLSQKQEKLAQKANTLPPSIRGEYHVALPCELHTMTELTEMDEQLTALLKKVEKAIEKETQDAANACVDTLLNARTQLKDHAGFWLANVIENADMALLQSVSDVVLSQYPDTVLLLAGTQGEKGVLLVKVGRSLTSQYSAKALLAQVLTVTGGGGGGNPEKAQAGGLNTKAIAAAFSQVSAQFSTGTSSNVSA